MLQRLVAPWSSEALCGLTNAPPEVPPKCAVVVRQMIHQFLVLLLVLRIITRTWYHYPTVSRNSSSRVDPNLFFNLEYVRIMISSPAGFTPGLCLPLWYGVLLWSPGGFWDYNNVRTGCHGCEMRI